MISENVFSRLATRIPRVALCMVSDELCATIGFLGACNGYGRKERHQAGSEVRDTPQSSPLTFAMILENTVYSLMLRFVLSQYSLWPWSPWPPKTDVGVPETLLKGRCEARMESSFQVARPQAIHGFSQCRSMYISAALSSLSVQSSIREAGFGARMNLRS